MRRASLGCGGSIYVGQFGAVGLALSESSTDPPFTFDWSCMLPQLVDPEIQKDSCAPFCPVAVDADGFTTAWVTSLLSRAKKLRTGRSGRRRWSLAECLMEDDWDQVLEWGTICPATQVPKPDSLVGGFMFLAFSAAVARTQDGNEALWAGVAKRMNRALLRTYFGSVTYPLDTTREWMREACERGHVRHQIDMPGKHRYWRTVMLQIGFAPQVGVQRLAIWLLGYGVPESISTLLDEEDENGSLLFRELWDGLQRWQQGTATQVIRQGLLQNPWFSQPVQTAIAEGLEGRGFRHSSQLRVEDENDAASLFSPALLRDQVFTLALSAKLPARFRDEPLLPFRIQLGSGTLDLVPDEHGRLRIEQGVACVSRKFRELEVKVFQSGEIVYRQQIELWQQEDDVTVFDAKTGRRVRDLSTFLPAEGTPYTLLSPADVEWTPQGTRIESANDGWRFHIYSNRLPPGLTASVEGFVIWSLLELGVSTKRRKAGTVEIRAVSMTRIHLRVVTLKGEAVRSFRMAGRTFEGAEGETDVSPTTSLHGRLIPAILKDGERVDLEACNVDRPTGMAYRDVSGEWRKFESSAISDGADLEGRDLAVSWNARSREDDCWLMLGDQPLRAQPEIVRRQTMRGMGEPLGLRFGLMNEVKERRIKLLSSTMYCGALLPVTVVDGHYRLPLREPSMRADEYEVYVWEHQKSAPRLIPANEVKCEAGGWGLLVNMESALLPLGWAISFDGIWKGSRFHVEPIKDDERWENVSARWLKVLTGLDYELGSDWGTLAQHLRWWRFPVLMTPFRGAVAERVKADGAGTLRAWVNGSHKKGMFAPWVDTDYVVPLREFLWRFSPSQKECARLLEGLWRKAVGWFADETGLLFPELRILLNAHPILLARMVCAALSELESEALKKVAVVPVKNSTQRQRDPSGEARVQGELRALRSMFLKTVADLGGVVGDDAASIHQLQANTLDELRSWTDKQGLDSMYFRKCIVEPAERMFDGNTWGDDQLKIAISRSPASRAFLVSHLVRKFGTGGTP